MSQADPLRLGADRPHVADEVIGDIWDRKAHGVQTYGVALAAHNGRRALQDLYEELLDGAHYVRQRLDEEDKSLRTIVGDASVRTSLDEIYNRIEVIRKNPGRVNKQSLEQRYVDDLSYMRMVTEALLVELEVAKRTPPPPPEGTEVARYQYVDAGPDGIGDYDDESYTQEYIEEWCRDPGTWTQGYYPVYRPLYGGQWYRVDPEHPPEQPESSRWGLATPEPTRDDGKPQ